MAPDSLTDPGARLATHAPMTLCRSAAVVALLALGGCVVVSPPATEVAPEPGEVRFEFAGPGGAALVVPVRVNDAGPFPFVLDTGATVTCLDEALVKELELPDATGTVAFGGGIRGLGRMRLVPIQSISVGHASARDLRGCVVDLAPMRQAGLDVRGLLGLNFLRAYRLTIDFNTMIVRLERPSA
jgi:hypothetical protein